MHTPRPFGRFVEDESLSPDDAAAVARLAKRLTNWKHVSGLDNLRVARTLPSGAIAIVMDMGGVRKVIIQPPVVESPPPFTPDGLAKSFIPTMFSGIVHSGLVRHGSGANVQFSNDTRRRLAGYDPEKLGSIPLRAELKRFVVELSDRFAELKPYPPPTDFIFTQYANLRPTWFSGAMAEVVQIVGGYGKQSLDGPPASAIDLARFSLPKNVYREIIKEIGEVRLPGYTGLPHSGGEIRYDYKFNQTHLVGFDSQGKPWLLQVGPGGVHAMPLPLVPATTTKAFRKFVDENGDGELIWALNRFGGLPSGEGFPSVSKDFEAWRRAGVIVKVCGTSDFYQHLMYSSAMGWTINTRGDEGFNTCFDFDDDTRITSSYAYKLRLRLGAAERNGWVSESINLADPIETQRLHSYLEKLYKQMPQGTARELAIKYKLRRVPVGDILLRANKALDASNIQTELDHWDNLEAEPIASHSGNVTQVGAGPLEWKQDGFKVPEPFQGGCISFESLGRPRPGNEVKRADTIMAGYYEGNQLKVIKYFADDRQYVRDVEDNYEECMIVGSWNRTITEGSTSLMGAYYTSDFDDREAAADTVTTISTVGTDLGYDHTPRFSYDYWFWRPGTIWRNRHFKHRTKTETTTGYSRSIAVCMPYLQRNAVLHARTDWHTGKSKSDITELHFIRDPWSYRYWTHDDIWAWIGFVTGPQSGVPVFPKNGNPVWVVQQNYNAGPCTDFADNGPWIAGLPADYTWLVHPDNNNWAFSGGGGDPTVNEQSVITSEPGNKTGQLDFAQLSYPITVSKLPPHSTYYLKSPDLYLGVFYRDAVKVAAGKCEYGSVSESHPSIPKARAFQGWCQLADHSTAHHFIGVINE